MGISNTIQKELQTLFHDQAENIEFAARSLKLLAHPARLKILCVLCSGEQTVRALEEYTGLRQTTLSQHLSLFKDRKILTSRREGNFSYYRIADEQMVELFQQIKLMYCD